MGKRTKMSLNNELKCQGLEKYRENEINGKLKT